MRRATDAEHLRLLAIFHFVVAALAILGIGFLFLHYFMMSTVFANPAAWKTQHNAPNPADMMAVFKWFYAFFALLLVTGALGNLLSGFFLLSKKHRVFSLVVGGLNCLQFPFGTALGVFTLLVLLRDSVQEAYAEKSAPLTPP
jgi:hypothetical protein